MALSTDADDSEDVNDFLKRIKELGDQRDKEDEERTRKLEQDIIQGRKEREARRAERARSLSPTKDTSNAGTPGSARSRNDTSMSEEFSRTPSLQPPPSQGQSPEEEPQKTNRTRLANNTSDVDSRPRDHPLPPPKPQSITSTTPPTAAVPLARAGTLSWQQRPTSRGSTSGRGRPTSMFASEKNATRSPRATPEPSTASDDNMSRSQIAQSLGSRDPSWFKQTQDRGLTSAAFRRNQVEDTSETSSATGSMRLPGMSRESTTKPESHTSPPPESLRSSSPSVSGSLRGYPNTGHKTSNSASTSSLGGIRSPLPIMSSQRLEPPSSDSTSRSGDENTATGRSLAMSPSQGRISPERMERPASPTKGLGGFVQSAMLKRSDSVNKRWSAQAGPGLSRGNSVASNLSGYGASRYPVGGITPLTESRQNSTSREASPTSNSRPGSSHSNLTVTNNLSNNDRPGKASSLGSNIPDLRFDETSTKPSLGEVKPLNTLVDPVMSPPASPSKRWSPTKSSWLENAINKPDSPKVKSPAISQPAWMAEISRAKQTRGSVDIGKGSQFKEVAIGGLVRSPPPGAGYKPPTISGLPGGFSAGVATKSRDSSVDDSAAGKPPYDSRKSGNTTTPDSRATQKTDHLEESTDNITGGSERHPDKKSVSPPLVKPKKPPADSITTSPPTTKSKPETPPKKDFRSELKARQSPKGTKSGDEPEFKNVFGNLKRTQTKNYVAPDEFKDNIMRGKNGLAQTGGPKKSERKDEFRESILQKKQGMVAPSASTRITSASSKLSDQPTPEAIAKRNGLSRSGSIQEDGPTEVSTASSKPEAQSKLQRSGGKSRVTSPEKKPGTAPLPKAGLGEHFGASLAGILQRGPSPMAGKTAAVQNRDDSPAPKPSAKQNNQASEGPQLTHATKARARGPKRRLPTVSNQDEPVKPSSEKSVTRSQSDIESKTPSSINVLKPRVTAVSPNRVEPRPLSNITSSNNNNRKPSQPASPRKPSTAISQTSDEKPASPVTRVVSHEVPSKSSPPIKQKPSILPENLNPRQAPTSIIPPLSTETPSRPSTQKQQPISSRTNGAKPITDAQESPLASVKGAAATWGQSVSSTTPARVRSPIKLPSRKDEETAVEEAGPKGKKQEQSGPNTPVKLSHESPKPQSPPLTGKKPASITNRIASSQLPPSATSQSRSLPSSQPSNASKLLAEILDEVPSPRQKVAFDTQAVLNTRAMNDAAPKIKTLRKHILLVTDNGKTFPVASHQEHILFEESIYICTHVFGNHAGQRMTEIYLWCGDEVPSAAAEDAHLFAKKFAKDNNGKLMTLRQGKETQNFFQALGGIVITRRGSSKRGESSPERASPYMLCGRQHVGQIAFDEVDYSPCSLCKGFPYIVSAPKGKLYLWKGSGAGVDELGCARLIGMDLGVTGEIEEVDEGRESDAFWNCFPEGRQELSREQAQHWHLKPTNDKYTNRLFSVNVEPPRPKSASSFIQGAMSWGRRGSAPANDPDTAKAAQIREVVPFAQSDLVEEGVYILDAFFEIFVILTIHSFNPAPHQKSTESASFRAALLFAQEYGILAASAEDRPFVPGARVVILAKNEGGAGEAGDIPEGMKRGFRKWDGNLLRDCRVLEMRDVMGVIEGSG